MSYQGCPCRGSPLYALCTRTRICMLLMVMCAKEEIPILYVRNLYQSSKCPLYVDIVYSLSVHTTHVMAALEDSSFIPWLPNLS